MPGSGAGFKYLVMGGTTILFYRDGTAGFGHDVGLAIL